MKNFSPERLEYLLSNMPTDMSIFEQRIKEIGLFDYDGIYATDISAGMLRYAREAEERNQYAADKLRVAFENVWEAEEAGVIKLREIREQLGEYSAYIQRLGEALTVDKGFSADGMHKNIQGIIQMYPTVGMDSLALIKIQREISRFVKEFFAKPDMLQGMSQKDIEAFLTSFENLHPGALTIAGVFLKKLQSDKYDYGKVKNYIKTFLYCGMERNGTYEPATCRYKDELTPEMIEELKEEIGLPDDFKVDKVVLLYQPEGAVRFGHVAVMLIGEDGSGLFYSYHGDFENHAGEIITGESSDGYMDRVYLNPEQLQTFFTGEDNGYISVITNGGKTATDKPYEEGIVYDIEDEQGWAMIAEAENIKNDENADYNLYASNCGHRASQILAAGGVEYGEPSGEPLEERLDNASHVYFVWVAPTVDSLCGNAGAQTILINNIAHEFSGVGTEIYSSSIVVNPLAMIPYLVGETISDGTIPFSTFEIEKLTTDSPNGALEDIFQEIKGED